MKHVLALWEADQQAYSEWSCVPCCSPRAPPVCRSTSMTITSRRWFSVLRAFDVPRDERRRGGTDGSAEDVVAALLLYVVARRLAGRGAGTRTAGGPYGQRINALAEVGFLRRPAEMENDDWRADWQGPPIQIALETQATFGYVQNRVTGTLTDDTPHIDAIVEELFRARRCTTSTPSTAARRPGRARSTPHPADGQRGHDGSRPRPGRRTHESLRVRPLSGIACPHVRRLNRTSPLGIRLLSNVGSCARWWCQLQSSTPSLRSVRHRRPRSAPVVGLAPGGRDRCIPRRGTRGRG